MKYRIQKQMKFTLNAKIYGAYINSSTGIVDNKDACDYSIIGNITDKFNILYDPTNKVTHLFLLYVTTCTTPTNAAALVDCLDISMYKKGDIICIILPYEGWTHMGTYLYNAFFNKFSNIDRDCFYFCNELLNYSEIKNQLGLEYNHASFISIDTWYNPVSIDHTFAIKTKDFLCYNRVNRTHRCQLIAELKLHDIINNGLVSFIPNYSFYDSQRDAELILQNDPLLSDDKKQAYRGLVSEEKIIDTYDYESNGFDHAQSSKKMNHYSKTMFSVVTESYWYEPEISFTEKIFGPIAHGHPFIVVAPAGYLTYIRRLGFKTFDGIIDETYDTITDHEQRMKAIVQEINVFCNYSVSEKREKWVLLNEIAQYNYKVFESKSYINSITTLMHLLGEP
jgi:hypothetical protein